MRLTATRLHHKRGAVIVGGHVSALVAGSPWMASQPQLRLSPLDSLRGGPNLAQIHLQSLLKTRRVDARGSVLAGSFHNSEPAADYVDDWQKLKLVRWAARVTQILHRAQEILILYYLTEKSIFPNMSPSHEPDDLQLVIPVTCQKRPELLISEAQNRHINLNRHM